MLTILQPGERTRPATGYETEVDRSGPKWTELDQGQRERLLDESRLAFLAEVELNWRPGLGTVLANEEVTNEGRSERGNYPVFKRPLKQWMLRITAYADRLIEDLDEVDWPEHIKKMQRDWIGRSEGARVEFPLKAKHVLVPVIVGDAAAQRFTFSTSTLSSRSFDQLGSDDA